MARNLIKDQEIETEQAPTKVEVKKEEPEVKLITENAYIIYLLEMLNNKLDSVLSPGDKEEKS